MLIEGIHGQGIRATAASRRPRPLNPHSSITIGTALPTSELICSQGKSRTVWSARALVDSCRLVDSWTWTAIIYLRTVEMLQSHLHFIPNGGNP